MKCFTTTTALFCVLALAIIPLGTPWCVHIHNQMNPQEKPMHAKCGAAGQSGEKNIPVHGKGMKICLEKWKLKMISCTLTVSNPARNIEFKPFPGDSKFKSKCAREQCFWVAAGKGIFLWNGPAKSYEQPIEWKHCSSENQY